MAAWPALVLLASTLLLWRLLCTLLRRRRSASISRLHPLRHSHSIFAHLNYVDFPFLARRSLEFGLFRTYAIPSISRILSRSGSFALNASKRYDDTDILLKELLLHHVDSDRGSLALRRLNFIHSQYKIDNNADFLYVLSIFILLPVEWISMYGYRSLTDAETASIFTLWHDVATRMGIRDIPSSIAEMAEFKKSYEEKFMVYSDANRVMADYTMKLLLSEVPAFMRPLVLRLAIAFLDERLRISMGYPKQTPLLRMILQGTLRLHGYAVKWMPPRPLNWSEVRIQPGCPALQGAPFNPDDLFKLSFHRYAPHVYKDGYRIRDVGALKPGLLADAVPGNLLLPLAECDNLAWPLPIMGVKG